MPKYLFEFGPESYRRGFDPRPTYTNSIMTPVYRCRDQGNARPYMADIATIDQLSGKFHHVGMKWSSNLWNRMTPHWAPRINAVTEALGEFDDLALLKKAMEKRVVGWHKTQYRRPAQDILFPVTNNFKRAVRVVQLQNDDGIRIEMPPSLSLFGPSAP